MKYNRTTVKAWAGDSQWRALRADLARFQSNGFSGWGTEGFWALAIYRMQKCAYRAWPHWIWMPARALLAVIKKLFTLVTHISIDYEAEIGPVCSFPIAAPFASTATPRLVSTAVCTMSARSAPAVNRAGLLLAITFGSVATQALSDQLPSETVQRSQRIPW